MKITGCDAFRYRLPLRQPVTVRGHVMRERSGLLVRFREAGGRTGWGEVAPLPGCSRESFEDAAQQCANIAFNPTTWGRLAEGRRFILPLHASVQFGVDCALLGLRAQLEGACPARALDAESPRRVALNGLIDEAAADPAACADSLCQDGFRAVKMKVGRRPPAEDVARIHAVAAVLKGRASLRLDANRAWELDDAITTLAALEESGVEYVEEPLREVRLLGDLRKRCAVPLALDESLWDAALPGALGLEGIVALVIKPTLIGGVAHVMRWGAFAAERGIRAVISSAYESGVGLWSLANLAAALPGRKSPAGLDTARVLAADLLEPAFAVTHGEVDLASYPVAGLPVRADLLEILVPPAPTGKGGA